MVQLSIVVFFGLFAAVEIYQSVKNVQLPMPVYLVLGILLAVASNASRHLVRASSPEEPSTLHGQK
jgi:ABC-type Na+ efflux pump permease subunit